MYFRNYALQRSWLTKCLKSPISEDLLTKALTVICKTLEHFANTLNVGHISSLLNRDNLTQSIQMHLSLVKKTVSQFVSSFLKSRLNFELFEKKNNDPHT